MASTSHKKCQYQGPNCMGTAHAGHDQCARCFYDYVKPALKAEREEVKRRRAIKRGHLLSAENRRLINEVDLKEPQMHDAPTLVMPIPRRRSTTIQQAITDLQIDKLLEGKNETQQLETLVGEMIKEETKDIHTSVGPTAKRVPMTSQPKEEQTPDVPKTKPTPTAPRGRTQRVSDQDRADIVNAYKSGIPLAEIAETFGIGESTIYRFAQDAGVSASRQKPKEPPMPQSTPPASPPKVEPTPPNGMVSGLTEWVVTYTVTRTETVTVAAKGFAGAETAAFNTVMSGLEGEPIEILSVAKKRS